MQGEITVTSRPYEGTTFTISLPFETVAEQPIRPLPELSGIACIVVESSGYSTADLVAYLEHGGASSQVAADTHSAAQIAGGCPHPSLQSSISSRVPSWWTRPCAPFRTCTTC